MPINLTMFIYPLLLKLCFTQNVLALSTNHPPDTQHIHKPTNKQTEATNKGL